MYTVKAFAVLKHGPNWLNNGYTIIKTPGMGPKYICKDLSNIQGLQKNVSTCTSILKFEIN